MNKITRLALAGVVTGSLVLGGLGCSSDKSGCEGKSGCDSKGKCPAKKEVKK